MISRQMTQHRISEKLGVSRAYVARDLRRLHDCGHVAFKVARVAEARKKRKVYVITEAGKAEAGRIAEMKNVMSPRRRATMAGMAAL